MLWGIVQTLAVHFRGKIREPIIATGITVPI